MNKAICVTANSDDTKALGAIGRMFLELAGESVFATATPMSMENSHALGEQLHVQPLAAAPTAEPGEAQPADVDTAAVFGAAASVPPAPAAPAPPAPPAPHNYSGAQSGGYTPAPAAPPAAVELDKSGLPWDSAINTSNRAQTAKGIWKRVPKISDEEYQAGLARLRATMAAPPPTPPAPAMTPGAGAAPITTAPPPPNATPAAPPTPTPAAPPAASPVPPPVDEAPPTTYALLLGAVSKRIRANLITHEEINNVCLMFGLPDLNAVSARPEFVPSIYEGCKAIWATRG